jgi:hypothetical protein
MNIRRCLPIAAGLGAGVLICALALPSFAAGVPGMTFYSGPEVSIADVGETKDRRSQSQDSQDTGDDC